MHIRKEITLTDIEEDHCNNLFPGIKKIKIPNGIDTLSNHFNGEFETTYIEGTGPKDIIFGFLGRMNIKIKGIDLMVSAINKIQKKYKNNNLKFVFVGPMYKPSLNKMNSKNDIDELDSYLNKLKYPERVIFSGPVFGKNKWSVLQSFDIFIQPSRSEGMPIAVLEAMAMGKPCLVTKSSSMSEIVTEANGGWVCEANVNSMFQSIEDIVNASKEVIKEKGNNVKNYVVKNHNWETVAKQFILQVETIMEN